MLKIGIIGAGTVGSALAAGLAESGYCVIAVCSRTGASAEKLAGTIPGCQTVTNNQQVADAADIVFITTPDAAIPQIASAVQWHQGQSVVHCSGADSTVILEPARQMGAYAGVFHPLQSFAGVKQATLNLPGSTVAIEAAEPLLTSLKEMAEKLNCRWIKLKAEDKVVYHAAAVIASNYLVTLVKLADDLWETFGIPREQATQALLPLLKGTLNNIETAGIPQALTGPIARGDIETVKKHIAALQKEAPDALSAYCELGLQTIPIAQAKGKIDEEKAAELRAVLKTGLKKKTTDNHLEKITRS
ncbi:MAG: DUF2520 domain-containing protein [Dehalococcoidales bacterium]|jgi:predicted short-subunit dehydrogenase-like oxidoreductase (DUF2520 family)